MRKINYRITVNITQKTMKLGFRAKMPEEMEGKRIRVQAVFTQRQVERRFPMEVVIEEGEIAHTELQDGMCFSIEPGLYNPDYFGVRLENSCYKKDGKIHSFVKIGYEGKLIDYNSLSEQEKEWLKDFEIL